MARLCEPARLIMSSFRIIPIPTPYVWRTDLLPAHYFAEYAISPDGLHARVDIEAAGHGRPLRVVSCRRGDQKTAVR